MGLNAKIGAYLEAEGRVEPGQLARAMQAASANGIRLDTSLVSLGFLSEADAADVLSQCFDIPRLKSLEQFTVDTGLEERFDQAYLRACRVVPLAEEKGVLFAAFADPLNRDLIDKLAFHTELEIRPLIAEPALIDAALDRFFPAQEIVNVDLSTDVQTGDAERLRELASEGPVVRLVQEMITQAVDRGASDIHFEAQADGVVIRMRLDGVLESVRRERSLSGSAIFSRLKVLANLNISERRLPQDGRIRMAVRGREVDFRLSTLPTQHGESAVLRVLDRSRLKLDLAELGFAPEIVMQIKEILDLPHGLFLVTGPTGSGKTTTLYAALQYLNREGVKILTVEDPIEYEIGGLNQVQVHDQVGLTFAAALRSALRQDPNILMIGEIRDQETAEMACRAALVGRLVLSTLHVNSAEEARLRLLDLGVDAYLVDAVLRGVLAQRLEIVRCSKCGGAGCEACAARGVTGRRLGVDLVAVRR